MLMMILQMFERFFNIVTYITYPFFSHFHCSFIHLQIFCHPIFPLYNSSTRLSKTFLCDRMCPHRMYGVVNTVRELDLGMALTCIPETGCCFSLAIGFGGCWHYFTQERENCSLDPSQEFKKCTHATPYPARDLRSKLTASTFVGENSSSELMRHATSTKDWFIKQIEVLKLYTFGTFECQFLQQSYKSIHWK